MKTSFLPQWLAYRSNRVALLGCCLAALFVSVHQVQAQITQLQVTNVWNFYANNGQTLASDGIDPDPGGPYGGEPFTGSYFFPTYAGYDSGTIPPTGPVIVNATSVSGSATFTLGPNPTGAGGMTITLSNPNSIPDEVRLDWEASYTNNGPTVHILGYVANITGSLTGSSPFYALAGGESIIYYNGVSITTLTATLQNGFTHTGLGTGPWYGGTGTSISATASAYFSSGGPVLTIGDDFIVNGYLDLVVDPGTIQVQIQTVQAPMVGIGLYTNSPGYSPVVFFPTIPGTNFVLQMATNLASPNWVPVTNAVPFSGFEITNAPSTAFFRLQ